MNAEELKAKAREAVALGLAEAAGAASEKIREAVRVARQGEK